MSDALPQRLRAATGDVLGLAGRKVTVLTGAAGPAAPSRRAEASTSPAAQAEPAVPPVAPAESFALRPASSDGWAELFSTVAAVRDRRRE
ncbi:hypothetical protein [Nocardia sp. NPDC057668]|uniref:hypothetical protein n=1 Tax=Nocardia sp. NPDC057668 TaxID=3346202 RepID=UPI003670564A